MGDIADMMLEGLLDEESGEYIGDVNKEYFGCEDPGFPISYERGECPICGKKLKTPEGVHQHMQAVHT